MKKILGIVFILLSFYIAHGQKVLTYETISTATSKPPRPECYISKAGTKYCEKDTLKMGVPSGVNGNWVHVHGMTWMGDIVTVSTSAENTNIIIKSLGVEGTKKQGFKVSVFTKGNGQSTNYYFNIEDAVEAGEVIDPLASHRMSSDQALAALKKEKDKLDLGLITSEQYEAKKNELTKYIK